MSRSVWRISVDAPAYEAHDLSGKGAEITGGRWNDAGTPLVYSASSRALACLETLAHLNAGGLPLNRYLVEIVIPDGMWDDARRETAQSLPVGWDSAPASLISIRLGTEWAAGASSALLLVPSAIVHEEYNILINPRHPHSTRLASRKIRRWEYDPRIVRTPA